MEKRTRGLHPGKLPPQFQNKVETLPINFLMINIKDLPEVEEKHMEDQR